MENGLMNYDGRWPNDGHQVREVPMTETSVPELAMTQAPFPYHAWGFLGQ